MDGVLNTCEVDKCERKSCLPPDYAPLCTRHYLQSVDQAEKDAQKRFEAHIADLVAKREREKYAES